MVIGWALALAQPGLGQVRGEAAWIDPGSRAYVSRFRELLLDGADKHEALFEAVRAALLGDTE